MKNNKVNRKEIDTNAFVAILKKYKETVSKTEESSKKFLTEVGIIDKRGNLDKNYENLCIPQEQG